MRDLVRLMFMVLVPVIILGILIYDLQNLPGYNNLPELQELYLEKRDRVVDHSGFEELSGPFADAHEITAACLKCHEARGKELLNSFHFTWEKEEYIEGRGVVYYGKKNALNNFCTGIAGSELTCNRCHAGFGYIDKSFDFTEPTNIDCMVCHDNSNTYKKASGQAGYPEPDIDYSLVFANLGTPRKSNCGTCHFNSAGGNNVKHGDLEIALLVSGKDVDVHMGIDGYDLECIDCHTTRDHVMAGRYYGLSSTNERRANCKDCHTKFPHVDDLINEHTIKVCCRVCHIPVYAKVNPTKMSWDWSTATTELDDGKAISIFNEAGEEIYFTDKGTFTWQKKVVPDYVWFNGTADHHLLTDSITEVPVKINTLFGSYDDPDSKIVPVKIHRGNQPYDVVSRRIVQAKLWDPKEGRRALWVDYDWHNAIQAGMEYLGLPFSGEFDFIETEMYLPVSHMVSPATEVLNCKDCHSRDNSRLAALTDFYMPGRDRNRFVSIAGKSLIIISLFGVFAHAVFRIIAAKKYSVNK